MKQHHENKKQYWEYKVCSLDKFDCFMSTHIDKMLVPKWGLNQMKLTAAWLLSFQLWSCFRPWLHVLFMREIDIPNKKSRGCCRCVGDRSHKYRKSREKRIDTLFRVQDRSPHKWKTHWVPAHSQYTCYQIKTEWKRSWCFSLFTFGLALDDVDSEFHWNSPSLLCSQRPPCPQRPFLYHNAWLSRVLADPSVYLLLKGYACFPDRFVLQAPFFQQSLLFTTPGQASRLKKHEEFSTGC